jgi:hypothetical protein
VLLSSSDFYDLFSCCKGASSPVSDKEGEKNIYNVGIRAYVNSKLMAYVWPVQPQRWKSMKRERRKVRASTCPNISNLIGAARYARGFSKVIEPSLIDLEPSVRRFRICRICRIHDLIVTHLRGKDVSSH